MKIDFEFEWDHGPDITIVFYAKRTHILSMSWNAYPVLGGAKPVESDDRPAEEAYGWHGPSTSDLSPSFFDPWFGLDDLHWEDLTPRSEEPFEHKP